MKNNNLKARLLVVVGLLCYGASYFLPAMFEMAPTWKVALRLVSVAMILFGIRAHFRMIKQRDRQHLEDKHKRIERFDRPDDTKAPDPTEVRHRKRQERYARGREVRRKYVRERQQIERMSNGDLDGRKEKH